MCYNRDDPGRQAQVFQPIERAHAVRSTYRVFSQSQEHTCCMIPDTRGFQPNHERAHAVRFHLQKMAPADGSTATAIACLVLREGAWSDC